MRSIVNFSEEAVSDLQAVWNSGSVEDVLELLLCSVVRPGQCMGFWIFIYWQG